MSTVRWHVDIPLQDATKVVFLSKQVSKRSVAVCNQPHRYGNSHAIQCYLPPGRGDIPALTPAEAGTRLSDPGGMQG